MRLVDILNLRFERKIAQAGLKRQMRSTRQTGEAAPQ
jgi:hypothetical protein